MPLGYPTVTKGHNLTGVTPVAKPIELTGIPPIAKTNRAHRHPTYSQIKNNAHRLRTCCISHTQSPRAS
jgi:hypothetical protein